MKKILFIILIFSNNSNLFSISDFEQAKNYYNKGLSLMSVGKYLESLSQFSAAIKLDPYNPHFWDRRGTAYGGIKDYISAISDYTMAINLAPQVGFYYFERALAYNAIGNLISMRNDIIISANLGFVDAQNIIACWIRNGLTV